MHTTNEHNVHMHTRTRNYLVPAGSTKLQVFFFCFSLTLSPSLSLSLAFSLSLPLHPQRVCFRTFQLKTKEDQATRDRRKFIFHTRRGNQPKRLCKSSYSLRKDPCMSQGENCLLPQEETGMGQNSTTRGPQVLVHVAIYQNSIWGTNFDRPLGKRVSPTARNECGRIRGQRPGIQAQLPHSTVQAL